MTIKKLEKETWHPYFDHVSKILTGRRAEIEVDSLLIGAQIEAEWLPLIGIVYDPKDDIIEIALDGLDHIIHHPREVYVDQESVALFSLEVIDADNTHQIVKLREPLMLPSPSGMRSG